MSCADFAGIIQRCESTLHRTAAAPSHGGRQHAFLVRSLVAWWIRWCYHVTNFQAELVIACRLPFIADEPADKSLEELFMNLRSPLRNLSWCWSSTCWPHYWPNQLLLLLIWCLRFNPLQWMIGSLLVQQTLLLQPVSTSPPLMIQLCRSPR